MSRVVKISCFFIVMIVGMLYFLNFNSSYALPSPILATAKIENVQTGTIKMDDDNDPGNDASESNEYVRSFDTVVYPLIINLESLEGDTYTNIKAKIIGEVDNGVSSDGRFLNAMFDSFWNGAYDLGLRTSTMEKEVVINATGSAATYNIPLNVYGASNGTLLNASFKVEILSADDEEGNTIDLTSLIAPIDITTDDVIVSSKVNLSAKLVESNSKISVDFDKYTDTTGNDPAVIKFHGVGVSLVPLNGRSNMLGVAYPTDNVSLRLESTVSKRLDADTIIPLAINSQTRPIEVFDYSVNENSGVFNNHLHLPKYNGHLESYDAITALPASKIGLSTNNNGSVTDSGIITMVNEGDYSISVNFSNFIVTNHAPTTTLGSSVSFNTATEKMFLVARFSSVIPMEALDANPALVFSLTVDEIGYEENSINGTINPDITLTWQESREKSGTLGVNQSYTNRNASSNLGGGTVASASGEAMAVSNQEIGGHSYFVVSGSSYKAIVGMQKWNPLESTYDMSKEVSVTSPYYLSTSERGAYVVEYGVAKDADYSTAALNAKTMDDYIWYSNRNDAVGDISAIRVTSKVVNVVDDELYGDFKFVVPRNLIGDTGTNTSSTPHMSLAYLKVTWLNDEVSEAGSNGANSYLPTAYTENGTVAVPHFPNRSYGDTLYIVPFDVKISKTSDKKNYAVSDTVQWTITPTISSVISVGEQTIVVSDTLSLGNIYEIGSSKYKGVSLEPIVSKNPVTGVITLTWTLDGVSVADLGKITYETTFNQRIMSFNSSGVSALSDTIMIASDGSKTLEKFRKYTYTYNVLRSLEYGIYKVVDKAVVEIGEEFTYTIGVYNNTASTITNVTGLDVLPKNGYMKTEMDGSFLLKSITSSDTDLVFYYTNEDIADTTDPNSIDFTEWILYTNQSNVEVKAIAFTRHNLIANQEEVIDIELIPVGNEAKNYYENKVFGNSAKNSKVTSNIVKTRVVGRSLEGFVWDDANSNGLIDVEEQLLEGVEVFLYRKINGSLELVTENLRGNKLVENNVSLVKTDEFGAYYFDALAAEVNKNVYVVGFRMPDTAELEFAITKEMATSDDDKTSKVYGDKMLNGIYLTGEYTLPLMNEIVDMQYIKPYINAGLVSNIKKIVEEAEVLEIPEIEIENPNTGDNILLFVALGLVGICGLGFVIKLKKRKN